jgi:hypothetical protein
MLGMMDRAMKVGSQLDMKASAPQFSAVCLGCHGTAAGVPEEFRAATFHIEDGVQCERCHGPGERYATEEIMKDRKKAVSVGLRLPDRTLCMDCHKAKPSHAFMEKKPFDFDTSYKKIVHMH